MWNCVSKSRLRAEAGAIAFSAATVAAAFAIAQSKGWIVGGAIALPKLAWLCYALLAWLFLPPLLARDGHAQRGLRHLYWVFFWNMAARGVIELVMMYWWHNWHPYYGVVHDLFSIGLILRLLRRVVPVSAVDRILVRHAFVLIAMLIAEITFALYFAANFVTRGERALYFVPNEKQYYAILIPTAIVVFCLTVYFPWFVHGWLFSQDEGGSELPGQVD